MKLIQLIGILILITVSSFAQINLEDSSVQVIGFWDKLEKQNYKVSLEKIKLQGPDTTSREVINYEVEITIKDSTSNSYLIEWFYKNYSISTENKILEKIMSAAEDIKVLIKTDEMGAIKEVVNWEEVRDYMKASVKKLRTELKDIPKIEEVIKKIENLYSTKAAIEAQAIMDAQQFYNFHGSKYLMGEIFEGQLKSPNLLGSEPFDSDFTVWLDEINAEDNNYILRSTQRINSQQLTEATFTYLSNLSKTMGVPPPKKEDVKDLTHETLTASRIHGSGWVVYSIFTKTVTSDNTSSIEERIIEIK